MTDEKGGFPPDDDEEDGVYRVRPDDPGESVTIVGPADEPPLRFDADEESPLRFEPDDTGPLPHWTEPPTGEVPRIFAEDVPDDLDEWAASATQAPVWREDRAGFDTDDTIDFASLGEGTRVGALDEQATSVDPFFDDESFTPEPEQSRVTPIRTRRPAPAATATRAAGDERPFGTGGGGAPGPPPAPGGGGATPARAGGG